MDRTTTRTALAVSNDLPSMTPNGRSDYHASLDCVARALGRERWQEIAAAPERVWSEPRRVSPCVEEISLIFAQDRERAAQRFPAEFATEYAEMVLGVAVIGRPDMSLPPMRRGMASVEFRGELFGEAYALQRLQDCRMRPEAMRNVRDWIEANEIPGCWKAPAERDDLTVADVVERAKAAGIIAEMVWLFGVGYDVAQGTEALCELPPLPFNLRLSHA